MLPWHVLNMHCKHFSRHCFHLMTCVTKKSCHIFLITKSIQSGKMTSACFWCVFSQHFAAHWMISSDPRGESWSWNPGTSTVWLNFQESLWRIVLNAAQRVQNAGLISPLPCPSMHCMHQFYYLKHILMPYSAWAYFTSLIPTPCLNLTVLLTINKLQIRVYWGKRCH